MPEPITRAQLEVMKQGASYEVALLIAEVERLQYDRKTLLDGVVSRVKRIKALRARVGELEKLLAAIDRSGCGCYRTALRLQKEGRLQ